MKGRRLLISVGVTVVLSILTAERAISVQDRYTVRVPNGLAFSEFRGYETWQVISISHNGPLLAVILGNPAMIRAYKAGHSRKRQAFPRWCQDDKDPLGSEGERRAPGSPLVAGTLHDVDFMVKDSKRFADSGGWGYGAFKYDPASDTFRPATTADRPPQANDAKCGFACHTVAKDRDYVFTEYPKR
jgi:hypothetical protein